MARQPDAPYKLGLTRYPVCHQKALLYLDGNTDDVPQLKKWLTKVKEAETAMKELRQQLAAAAVWAARSRTQYRDECDTEACMVPGSTDVATRTDTGKCRE